MVRHYWHNLGFSFKSVLRDQEVQFNRSSAVLQSKHFSGLSGCANSNGHRVGQAYHELQLCKARHMMKIVPLTLKVAACKKLRQGWGTKKSRNTESTTSAVRGLKACLKLACSYHIACVVFFFRPLSLSPWWPLPCSECLAVHRSELPGTSDQIAHPAAPITGMNWYVPLILTERAGTTSFILKIYIYICKHSILPTILVWLRVSWQ